MQVQRLYIAASCAAYYIQAYTCLFTIRFFLF